MIYIVSCDWLIFKTQLSQLNEQRVVNRYFSSKEIRRLHVFSTFFLIQGDVIFVLKHVSEIQEISRVR